MSFAVDPGFLRSLRGWIAFEAVALDEYVLATKYHDGDPCDHFYVGFVIGDSERQSQRANGFRRVEIITNEEGKRLIELFPMIGDRRGPSLWWHLARIRGEENPNDPCDFVGPVQDYVQPQSHFPNEE